MIPREDYKGEYLTEAVEDYFNSEHYGNWLIC